MKMTKIFNGLKQLILKKMSIQFHFLFFFIILYFANLFEIKKMEWLLLLITFVIVIILEILKVLADELCDLYNIDKNLHIHKIKEISNITVLLASMLLLAVVLIIFLPYLRF